MFSAWWSGLRVVLGSDYNQCFSFHLHMCYRGIFGVYCAYFCSTELNSSNINYYQCNVVLIFMQFTGCDQPVQRSHSPENAIDWLG